MKPDEFILLSGRIVSYGSAGARSAVSRAYYGAYHLAYELLFDVGCAPTGGRSHSDVPNYLECATDQGVKDAARLLKDLHGRRVKADYYIRDTSIELLANAQIYVEMAVEIQEQLGRYKESMKDPELAKNLKDSIDDLKRRMSGS